MGEWIAWYQVLVLRQVVATDNQAPRLSEGAKFHRFDPARFCCWNQCRASSKCSSFCRWPPAYVSSRIFVNPLRRIEAATAAACSGFAMGSLEPLLRKNG